MSTPTDLLSNLSLNSQMAPTPKEAKARALELQDILSSFDFRVLPSEFKPNLFANIDRPEGLRPQSKSEWTISSDLEGTLLQWGAYDGTTWEALRQLQSPAALARCFHEKLNRRFKEWLDHYDGLPEARRSELTLREEIYDETAMALRSLVVAVQKDREYRSLGEHETLRVLLSALREICHRDESKGTSLELSQPPTAGARRSARKSTTNPSASATENYNLSLFDVLIRHPPREDLDDPFMLEALEEHFSPAAIERSLPVLTEIHELLLDGAAPQDYVVRFEAVLKKAKAGSPSAGPSASGSATHGHGHGQALEADPRPGSKRGQPTAEGTDRRGRKRAGK